MDFIIISDLPWSGGLGGGRGTWDRVWGEVRCDVSEASTEEVADPGGLGLERTGVAAARWSVWLLTGSDRGRDGSP